MLIIENATVVDLTRATAVPDQHLAIVDSTIVEVSPTPIASADAERIDLEGAFVLPGLIDAHFHATLTETNPAHSRDLPATLMTARAGTVLRNALNRGFTTVRDMCGADYGLRTAVAEGSLVGPRMFIAGRALSQTGGHGDLRRRTEEHAPCACSNALAFMSVIADGVSGVQAAAREQLRQGVDHLKVFVSGGVTSPNDPLASAQYTDAELEAIVEEALHWGTYVAAHAYTPAAITRAVRAGIRTIEHGNLLDRESAREMAQRGAYLVPTLVTYEAMRRKGPELGLPPQSLEKLGAVAEAGLHSLELAIEAGVQIGFGTDLLGDLQAYQCDEFSIRAEVQAPVDILRSATQVNARILGKEGVLGVVQPGATADLIACIRDPLRDAAVLRGQGEALTLIVKDGRVVKRGPA